MKASTILSFAFLLALSATAQDASRAGPQGDPKSHTQAHCKFSDGKTITAIYSSQRSQPVTFTTNENLITVKGTSVPAGEYSMVAGSDPANNWTVTMKKSADKSWQSSPLPMTVVQAASPAGTLTISFEPTGVSCTMQWGWDKSKTLVSLEFTERNTDLPLEN
jgi:Protein of unknown function (DUF2911)